MTFHIAQAFSEEYFQEHFDQWVRYRSQNRKWQRLLGGVVLACGLLAYGLYPSEALLTLSLAVIGLGIIIDFYWVKQKWLKARRESRMFNKTIQLKADEAGMEMNSPFSETKVGWDYFSGMVETPAGVFLIPEKGQNIYLQRANLPGEEILPFFRKKIRTL
ncbi:MAG: hypothetical protein AAFR61_13805 [Bacteroidota bacterium]